MKRVLLSVAAVLAMVVLFGTAGQAGDKKASPWKPFLPLKVYDALMERSRDTVRMHAKSEAKDAIQKILVELTIREMSTLSVKDPWHERYGAQLAAIAAARKQELKELAAFGATIPVVPKADLRGFKPSLPPLADLMEIFRNKSKGGEGLHADLQYHPKLKNLNGMEALIGAKKLSDENMNKVAKELPLFAYRVAVVGALTHEYPQEKGAGEWRELSLKMRDASIAMAEAAQKKDADGVFKAAQVLESSCTQCHSAFKKK